MGVIAPARRPAILTLDRADPINRGLRNHWPMLGEKGAIFRDLGVGRRGLAYNSPTRLLTKQGIAPYFNGSSQYFDTGYNDQSMAAGTFSWWQNSPTAWNGAARVIWGSLNGAGEFSAQIFIDGNWYIGWRNGGTDTRLIFPVSAANWPQNVDTHYAFVWGPAGSALYVNGALAGSTATAPSVANFNTPFFLAVHGSGGTVWFPGALWHARWHTRALQAKEAKRLYSSPFVGIAIPRSAWWWMGGAASVSVSLTGSAITASRGTLTAGITNAATGSAATGAAGTLTSALGSSVSGSAGTGAIGTVTPGIGMALTGSALTMSSGSLAYTIGFVLTGVSSASAGGTLSTGGGDTEAARSLTGISMSALPGNVRVTGGTRWVPQQARAVAIATTAGNTMPPPPRLTGDIQTDIRAQQQYLQTFYDQFVKVNNVLGRINDHETRIASLEEGS